MWDELAVETIENSFQIGRNHPMIKQHRKKVVVTQVKTVLIAQNLETTGFLLSTHYSALFYVGLVG
ncbi:hypothetical protein [Nostoc commune]|uniref:hypothetical protein n=1 Tax=Nostoc commune TaxID=1178 RepID=UPI0018C7E792|nr:hypothetical protein [Nostoc commune]MBG1261899.1 hypothetical protein [Nostoc commune BAE]